LSASMWILLPIDVG